MDDPIQKSGKEKGSIMFLSSRVKGINEAVTLKLNERAQKLIDSGVHVYNLTLGQLPFKAIPELTKQIEKELSFIKSFQYSPIGGYEDLKDKVLKYTLSTRNIDTSSATEGLQCVFSNGAKHSLYNLLGATIDPGDEVVIIAPYWVSYPEMIKIWGGQPIVIKTKSYNAYIPDLEEIKKVLTPRTKMIIINSPNNPSGNHYPDRWMEDFAQLMTEYPDVWLLSDEIYYELYYYDPKPTYFYQKKPELLNRTMIVDGVSKSLAAPGLRLGYTVAPPKVCKAIELIQAQTTSGPNSLVQRAFLDCDFSKIPEFLNPIRNHLRRNADILREVLKDNGLANCWYQTTSAFYFTLDLSVTPCFARFSSDTTVDCAQAICEELLEKEGVAVIPTTDFGMKNGARISLILEKEPFTQAMEKLSRFLSQK